MLISSKSTTSEILNLHVMVLQSGIMHFGLQFGSGDNSRVLKEISKRLSRNEYVWLDVQNKSPRRVLSI